MAQTDAANVPRVLEVLMTLERCRPPELAALLGISRSSFYERLGGKRPFTLDEVAAMAERFGVHPGLLFEDPRALVARPPAWLSDIGPNSFEERLQAASLGGGAEDVSEGAPRPHESPRRRAPRSPFRSSGCPNGTAGQKVIPLRGRPVPVPVIEPRPRAKAA